MEKSIVIFYFDTRINYIETCSPTNTHEHLLVVTYSIIQIQQNSVISLYPTFIKSIDQRPETKNWTS
jgi:hypothetical protein